MKSTFKQPWIASAPFDLTWIVGPPLLVSLAVICFPSFFQNHSSVSPLAWLILVVGVDVSHVYSTLYRTYFDSKDYEQNKSLYNTIPIICWVIGIMLYSIHPLMFWSILAYLAVFHFIRQQYGFMMIYNRNQSLSSWERNIDRAAIYISTLYPLIYWHTHIRNFHWMIDGDFLSLPLWINSIAVIMYSFILVLYLANETRTYLKDRHLNLPKNLLVMGTALSWYLGIVRYNSDLAFTFTNVLAHGIPYIALIWFYGRRKHKTSSKNFAKLFRPALIGIFLLILLGLAYVEEGLWDALVWKDHSMYFSFFQWLPSFKDPTTLSWIVPLLAVPQATHYVLDGFIWRFRKENSQAKTILFGSSNR